MSESSVPEVHELVYYTLKLRNIEPWKKHPYEILDMAYRTKEDAMIAAKTFAELVPETDLPTTETPSFRIYPAKGQIRVEMRPKANSRLVEPFEHYMAVSVEYEWRAVDQWVETSSCTGPDGLEYRRCETKQTVVKDWQTVCEESSGYGREVTPERHPVYVQVFETRMRWGAMKRYDDALLKVWVACKSRMEAVLRKSLRPFQDAGCSVSDTEVYIDDEYQLILTVFSPIQPGEPIASFLLSMTLTLAEERVRENADGNGVTFLFSCVGKDGQILGEVCPQNFTEKLWIPVTDLEAISERLRLFEEADYTALPKGLVPCP